MWKLYVLPTAALLTILDMMALADASRLSAKAPLPPSARSTTRTQINPLVPLKASKMYKVQLQPSDHSDDLRFEVQDNTLGHLLVFWAIPSLTFTVLLIFFVRRVSSSRSRPDKESRWLAQHRLLAEGDYLARRRSNTALPAVELAHAFDSAALASVVQSSVGIAAPCQLQMCGDELYRATLNPLFAAGEDAPIEALVPPLAALGAYLVAAKPGVLAGIFDSHVAAPIFHQTLWKLNPKSLKVLRKLGSGGFGEVYLAEAVHAGKRETIVLKRAREFGQAEVWMNERVSRADPTCCARLVDSFEIQPDPERKKHPQGIFGNTGKVELWLAFAHEGTETLADFLKEKAFPYNMEETLFGAPLVGPKGMLREAQTIQAIMRQLASTLASLHGMGIVHRDIKPENCLVTFKGSLKWIDLGAAADLRYGRNYMPHEWLMDPRYTAPGLLVMDGATPPPPPKAIANLFAPALWMLNVPDRFDIYSLGILFLQLCFPALRPDAAIKTFNKSFADYFKYDLDAWRRLEERKKVKGMKEGFDILDLDGQSGWALLKQMLSRDARLRPTACDVLDSPFLTHRRVALTTRAAHWLVETTSHVAKACHVDSYMKRTTTGASLSESQLDEMFNGDEMAEEATGARTVAWWQSSKRSVKM